MNLLRKLAFVGCVLFMAGCADLDEIFENPNGVSPDQADAESLYNNVQITYANLFNDPYFFAAGLARMDSETGGFTYSASHSPTEFDGMWARFYSQLIPDVDAFIAIVEPLGLDAAAASAKIMKAYGYMQFVDIFGDVPFSEAGMGNADTPITNPKDDPGAEVYAAANALLDEAIAQLDGADDFDVAFDNFYGGDAASWATLAKTLKLRNAVTTRLVGGGGAIAGIVSEGDIIDTNAENFEWTYGTSRANPNNRHPFYNDSYEEADGSYQSTWYMWLLAESKGFPDPRVRYYFYRQNTRIFPNVVNDDPNAFDCIDNASGVPEEDYIPAHYEAISEDMPFCLGSYSQSYYGRDHLNGSGIPPDGDYRTIFGLYPAGGIFDDATTNGLTSRDGTDGALGAGIEPIWQASFTHFILAEAALTGNFDEGDARELLTDGIQLSMDRVTAFESLVDGGVQIADTPTDVFVEDTFAPDSVIAQYIAYVQDEFDDADDADKLGIVAREYMIALFGNGLEAYNLYRRTCLTVDQVQPAIDPNPGNFIRSSFYPSRHVNRNINADQKASFTEPVFWDTQDASCTY